MPAWAAVAGVLGGALFIAAGEWEHPRAAATGAQRPEARTASIPQATRG